MRPSASPGERAALLAVAGAAYRSGADPFQISSVAQRMSGDRIMAANAGAVVGASTVTSGAARGLVLAISDGFVGL